MQINEQQTKQAQKERLTKEMEKRLIAFTKTLFGIIKGLIYSMLKPLPKDWRELAEDIQQTVIGATWVWIKKGEFQEGSPNIEGYARRVAHNKVIDEYRKRKKMPIDDLSPESKAENVDIEANIDIQNMLRAIDKLDKKTQRILRHYLSGGSLSELAKEGIISESDAKRGYKSYIDELRVAMANT